MRVGILLPLNSDDAPGASAWRRVRELAQHAEAAGLDSLWLYDHLLFRFPGESERGPHEAWTTLAAVAAVTTRVELGTLVAATSFRPPALLAKVAATLDEIAAGRLTLGLGCGWHEPEYRAFGYPFDHRVGRFEEALQVVLPLLRGERVTFHGRWLAVEDAVLLPPPAHSRAPAHIPILIASKGERMNRLAARWADAWNTVWYARPNERYATRREALVAACDAERRDPASIDITVGLRVNTIGEPTGPGAADVLPPDVAAIAAALDAWSAEGVAHVQVDLQPTNESAIDLLVQAVGRHRGG